MSFFPPFSVFSKGTSSLPVTLGCSPLCPSLGDKSCGAQEGLTPMGPRGNMRQTRCLSNQWSGQSPSTGSTSYQNVPGTAFILLLAFGDNPAVCSNYRVQGEALSWQSLVSPHWLWLLASCSPSSCLDFLLSEMKTVLVLVSPSKDCSEDLLK